MIKAIAIDDEQNALAVIEQYARETPVMELVATFTNPAEGQHFVLDHTDVQLVFLDIQMLQVNGLSLIRTMPPHVRIIITTAYPEYAVEGFELDILDFLLKPFGLERFQRSINKYIARTTPVPASYTKAFQQMMMPGSDDFIFVKTEYKVLKVKLDELKFLEGAGNYVALHTVRQGKVLTLQNIKAFEESLRPYQFIRIHRSYIVSLRFVDAVENNTVVIGQHRLPIGSSYRDGFLNLLGMLQP